MQCVRVHRRALEMLWRCIREGMEFNTQGCTLTDKDINLDSHLLFATAIEDSGHLSADNDDAMMVEEDSGPVEDAGEWPIVKFI